MPSQTTSGFASTVTDNSAEWSDAFRAEGEPNGRGAAVETSQQQTPPLVFADFSFDSDIFNYPVSLSTQLDFRVTAAVAYTGSNSTPPAATASVQLKLRGGALVSDELVIASESLAFDSGFAEFGEAFTLEDFGFDESDNITSADLAGAEVVGKIVVLTGTAWTVGDQFATEWDALQLTITTQAPNLTTDDYLPETNERYRLIALRMFQDSYGTEPGGLHPPYVDDPYDYIESSFRPALNAGITRVMCFWLFGRSQAGMHDIIGHAPPEYGNFPVEAEVLDYETFLDLTESEPEARNTVYAVYSWLSENAESLHQPYVYSGPRPARLGLSDVELSILPIIWCGAIWVCDVAGVIDPDDPRANSQVLSSVNTHNSRAYIAGASTINIASYPPLADNDPISTWNSSYGDNALSSTGSARPVYKTGIINSKPVARFDGSNDFMSFASNITTGDYCHIGAVLKLPTTDSLLLSKTVDNRQILRFNEASLAGKLASFDGSNYSVLFDAFTGGTWAYVEMLVEDGEVSFYINGTSVGSGDFGSVVINVLGYLPVGPALYFNGDIAAVHIASSPSNFVNAYNRFGLVSAWVESEYGLTIGTVWGSPTLPHKSLWEYCCTNGIPLATEALERRDIPDLDFWLSEAADNDCAYGGFAVSNRAYSSYNPSNMATWGRFDLALDDGSTWQNPINLAEIENTNGRKARGGAIFLNALGSTAASVQAAIEGIIDDLEVIAPGTATCDFAVDVSLFTEEELEDLKAVIDEANETSGTTEALKLNAAFVLLHVPAADT